ncbi:integrator complex assembly factor WDR73 isoform X4 [Pelodiscus sinensis]|uniref:integrator complex assembly factor WDR73 isoform X4 n=1 Tax=Pelodiscus sinensis TaxID=13735 RepID=UPI003F6DA3F7
MKSARMAQSACTVRLTNAHENSNLRRWDDPTPTVEHPRGHTSRRTVITAPSLLVTSGPPDGSLQIWQLAAEDTGECVVGQLCHRSGLVARQSAADSCIPDVIKSVSTIPAGNDSKKPWAKIATIFARAPCVLHGSRVNNLQVTEIESKKTIYAAASRSSDEISGLAFLDCHTLLACCVKGQLCLADVRQPQSPLGDASIPLALGGEQWCMGVLPGCGANAPTVARLSSGGQLMLTDLRNIPTPLKSAKCKVSAASPRAEFLCVSWAPALDGHLAVSGFHGTIDIYDTQGWPVSGVEAEPLFSHKGHLFSGTEGGGDFPLVTAHVWHPWKPRTLLSAASDGSLHVWDWAEPHKNSS